MRVLEDEVEEYFVEEGYYATKQKAEERQKVLSKQGLSLAIEKRGPLEIPANLQ